ncbi:MAG: hypothetical protein FJY85_07560 [Deltaproteobacteria bacterium]|nr:hypothetical protein [Deltaproteobacteria bacterium]
MFRTSNKYQYVLLILAVTIAAAASALAADTSYSSNEPTQSVTKVKPSPSDVWKVKSVPGLSSGFKALSGIDPAYWGPDCYLPTSAKGQFVVGPKVWFANVSGQARKVGDVLRTEHAIVDFQDHLGLRRGGNVVWSIDALYQLRPRWALTYSFAPLLIEATGTPLTAFSIGGRSFASGVEVRSKWERWEHRAGLLFNLTRTTNGATSLFGEWIHLQDRLAVRDSAGLVSPAVWDDDTNVAMLGLRFDKCLKNYRGNTLAVNAKGGIAFLDDSIGYEAELGLNYMIPIKAGRFGFVKGGYRYFNLKKENPQEMFGTWLHGAFVQAGFLF